MNQSTQNQTSPPQAAGAADPSMEDILASIRRILSDDEQPQPTASAAAQASVPSPALPDDGSDVLDLSESMMVSPEGEAPVAEPDVEPVEDTIRPPAEVSTVPDIQAADVAPVIPVASAVTERLVAPEAEALAATSVSALVRTLVQERDTVAVYRGGPTIEDLVREEVRLLLKTWLDMNLPPLVERLVRTEIERVVGRVQS